MNDAAPLKPKHKSKRNPWLWVPSLYYAEGIPYVVVMTVSVIMYKRLGISNTDIALYTSWLYLPWVIKPLWSPVVDVLKTKRFWIVVMQLIIGAGLGGVALTIPVGNFFKYTLAFFWLLAFSSATHDIAADGFYMLGLSKHRQAWFVGVRSTFYRFAMITGQGLLIILAGYVESTTGLPTQMISVATQPGAEITAPPHPDSLAIAAQPGKLHLVTFPETLKISTTARSKSEVDSLIAFAKSWNSHNATAKIVEEEMQRQQAAEAPSWWTRYVSRNLEAFLRKYFGPETEPERQDHLAGNVGLVYFYLSGVPEPGQEIVVNFGRVSGDKSISLVEGARFVFDRSNWNRPFVAVVQLDSKLTRATRTEFSARAGNIPFSWIVTFAVLTGLFLLFFVYHKFILPYPAEDVPRRHPGSSFFGDFIEIFVSFFRKQDIGAILAFLLLFRFAEAQLVKLASPFLLDAQEAGGLALTTGEVGFVYGTVGIVALTLGGLLGGFLAARNGLKYWLWWMVIAINLPDAVYVYLSYALPQNFLSVNMAVAVEQFGYGFGFTAYMLYMIYAAEGEHKTAHFAICTGFMALGMMIPGMFSGWLQEIIGYQHFFIWVLLATIPGFVVTKLIPLDSEFGKKTGDNADES